MNILLVCDCPLPVSAYDDKARMVWWLGQELVRQGHHVTMMLREEVTCSFAQVIVRQEKLPLEAQVPSYVELIHYHCEPKTTPEKPYLITFHENALSGRTFDRNTVFLSGRHAQLHGGAIFVYPGADFSTYSPVDLEAKRIWYHFLGSSNQKGRNVRGAIDLCNRAGGRLHVIGGSRVNFRQGFRIPLSTAARFHGILSPDGRDAILNASKGLIFPVLWEEPFSLMVVESLYFGCPVFGTPFGAMPEMLGKKVSSNKPIGSGTVEAFYADYGCLSLKKAELIEAIRNPGEFERDKCHDFARSAFSVERMARDYLNLYEQVLNGWPLHDTAPALQVGVQDKTLALG